MNMKQFLGFVVFVAALLGLAYFIMQNKDMFNDLKMPRTNIRMPTLGN
jgi:hypothetical protein